LHLGEQQENNEQKISKRTRSTSDIVPKSSLSSSKCLDTFISFTRYSVSSELASSEQLAGEQQVGSSLINESSNRRLGHQHAQNHYHKFGEQKLYASRNYRRAEIVSEQNM